MRKPIRFRAVALGLLAILLSELLCPPLLLALTGGPIQMEFAGVGPGASSEMVDLFSGEFSYSLPLLSVPGPHGSGYPVTLKYNSNMSPEEDASWVGFGWTLSPGAITRSKNGLADDLNGAKVTYYNKSIPNITVTAGEYDDKEVADTELPLARSKYLRYNNYSGWSVGRGFFGSVMGIVSIGLNSGDEGPNFSASVRPVEVLNKLAGNNLPGKILPPLSLSGNTLELNPSRTHPTKSAHFTGRMGMAAVGNHKVETLLKGETYSINGSYVVVDPISAETKNCYGYMYSGNATMEDIMDYGVEKDKPFRLKRNKFLSIPFSNPDDFIATGSGVGGKFRLYHDRVGRFRPAAERSFISILNTYLEGITGDALGFSGEMEDGGQTITVGEWFSPDANTYSFGHNNSLEDEPYYFRFDGDRGGSSIYDPDSDGATQAKTNGIYDRRILPSVMNQGERQGRNSYIGFHTVEDMRRTSGNDVLYLSYDKDNSSGSARTWIDRENANWTAVERVKHHNSISVLEKSIGEFALVGTNGSRYSYGLPVYTREETDLAYSVNNYVPAENNYLVRHCTDDKKLGEYRPAPYASTYLLTEVTTPNYVDVNNNGPDDQDLGGYTKFRYHQAYGSPGKILQDPNKPWYRWRTPYKGLRYEKNTISEPRDDIARMNGGEKEVYYMRSIETKTHIAYFVTNLTDITINGKHIQGSQTMRLDACQANPDENGAILGSTYPPANFENKMEYLEEIRLYAKDDNGLPGKLLKTTHFVYDYSLMRQRQAGSNDLNSLVKPGTQERAGKLTLRYVWFESEDVVNPLISPYEFIYQYPSASLDPKYSTLYPAEVAPPGYTEEEQNPEYSVFNIDGWGKYQKDGGSRYNQFMTWVNQNPSAQFDPAAWHLKIIRFPSGGELHVQYEQNEYAYVQDRPAMAMVRLLPESQDDDLTIVNIETGVGDVQVMSTVNQRNKFYLDIDNSFGTLTPAQRTALKEQIKHYFIDAGKQREKMYFRFRYELPGISAPCNQEDINGYATVYDCNEENGKIYVRLGRNGSEGIGVLAGDQPRYVAYGFKETHDRRLLAPCSGSVDILETGLGAVKLMGEYMADPALLEGLSLADIPTLDKGKSYLRIPMPALPKKGGGVRVKRLFMFSADGSLESGDKVLSGSEYLYETFEKYPGGEQKISSGVATNEPAQSREENSLVKLIFENDLYVFNNMFFNHVVAGEDVVQCEGMLGESLLPAPSVGYSRVIVRSIGVNTGTAGRVDNPGFAVYDFLTAKDHPQVEYVATKVEHEPNESDFLMEMLQNVEEEHRLTQGYTFVKNNFHGVTKAVHWYGGVYDPDGSTKDAAFANAYAVSSQEYEYFEPGVEVPVMYAPDRPLRMRPIGKQTEVLMEARSIADITKNLPIQYSAAWGNKAPYALVSLMPYMYNNSDELYQHVTTKIIDNPVLLKKVRSTTEGIVSEVENLVFDAKTGAVVVTHTTDGYHGLDLEQSENHEGGYYIYSLPAHMMYKDLGQYAESDGFVFHNVGEQYEWTMPGVEMTVTASPSNSSRGGTSAGTCTFALPAGSTPTAEDLRQVRNRLTRLLHTFAPGDMVEMKHIKYSNNKQYVGSKGIYYTGEVTNDIDNATNPSLSFQLFDPHFGSTPGTRPDNGEATGAVNCVQIIHSGKDDNTFASAGAVVTYGTRIKAVTSAEDPQTAIQCAMDIRGREKQAHMLNSWLHAANGHGEEEILGELSPLFDHTFTWENINPIAIPLRDIVNERVLPLNPIPNPLEVLSCNTPASILTDYSLFCDTDNKIKEQTKFRITKKGTTGSEIVTMGWWDFENDGWLGTPESAGGIMQQELVYTGKERFGVNDDGDLVWYQYPEEATNTLLNLSTVFRGTPEHIDVPQLLARVNAIPGSVLEKTLGISAQTFHDDWPHDFGSSAEYNLYELGKKGYWRPNASFVYRDGSVQQGSYDENSLTPGPDGRFNERVYKNAGTFSLPSLFNYADPAASVAAGWIQPISVEKIARHGNVEQVKDILNLHASSRSGHGGTVQSISAAPAEAGQINFDSFEDHATGAGAITGGVAHTGKYSHILNAQNTYLSPPISWAAASVAIRFWVRGSTPASPVNISFANAPVSPSVVVDFVSSSLTVSSIEPLKVARTGEWTLFEVGILPYAVSGTGPFQLRLSASSGNSFYVDDVVIRPALSEAVCYVYERNTLRPRAVFGNDHFAMIYQYDGEGKFTRLIQETVKGYKTMREGFIHLPEDKLRASLLAQGDHVLSISGGGNGGGTSMRQRIRSQSMEQDALQDNTSLPVQLPSQGVNGSFDLLNLNITPDKTSWRWFGQDSTNVPSMPQAPSVANPLNSVRMPSIPAADSIPSIRRLAPSDSLNLNTVRKRAADSVQTRINSSTGKTRKQP